eukprot:536693-Hanusia_phi.AAC.1
MKDLTLVPRVFDPKCRLMINAEISDQLSMLTGISSRDVRYESNRSLRYGTKTRHRIAVKCKIFGRHRRCPAVRLSANGVCTRGARCGPT